MKLIQLPIIALAMLTLLYSCSDNKQTSTASAAPSLAVEAYKVTLQSFNNKVITTANLMANEQVELVAPISGQVLEIFFKEGQRVPKNAAIIRLDDRNWRAQLVSTKASLQASEKDLERKKELLDIEGSSQEEIDNANTEVQRLRSEMQQLQINIDLANVSAPFAGQIGLRNFSKGAFLQPGTPITTLTELGKLKVDFTLAQAYQNSVTVGKTVAVIVGSDTLNAKIYAISPVINVDTRTINVRAMLVQPKGKTIMPGTFAEVLVSTENITDAVLIPTQAIVPSINEQTVYVSRNGKAKRVVVEMGNRTVDNVHIVNGLSAGDTVITTGLLQIKDGMSLSIQNLK